jgi:hypothetical protein
MISMKHSILSFMLIMMCPFLIGNLYCQNSYPEWFLHPVKYPQYITGYSTAGVIEAIDDAIWRYSLSKEGYLVGDASYFNNEDKWERDYLIEAQSPLIQKKQIQEISCFQTSLYGGGEQICIFEQSIHKNDEMTTFVDENVSDTRPAWVKKGSFFSEKDDYYGVGKYVLKGNENDAWRTAEEDALIELASAVGIGIYQSGSKREIKQGVSNTPEIEESVNILTYSFNHEFRDLEVLERWLDYKDIDPDKNVRAYIYVLVRIKATNIKQHLTRN